LIELKAARPTGRFGARRDSAAVAVKKALSTNLKYFVPHLLPENRVSPRQSFAVEVNPQSAIRNGKD
jgi:hypothetical protein